MSKTNHITWQMTRRALRSLSATDKQHINSELSHAHKKERKRRKKKKKKEQKHRKAMDGTPTEQLKGEYSHTHKVR